MRSFKIHVAKDYLVFCAGHFITYGGHLCEALHGHNYRVGVVLEGALDENWYVFDFVTLKRLMKRLVDRLDHRMLLPLHNPLITLAEGEGHITATYGERRYTVPQSDVVLLPIPNTTAEMLAEYLAKQLQEQLAQASSCAIHAIEIEVEESFGQSAIYREENRDGE